MFKWTFNPISNLICSQHLHLTLILLFSVVRTQNIIYDQERSISICIDEGYKEKNYKEWYIDM